MLASDRNGVRPDHTGPNAGGGNRKRDAKLIALDRVMAVIEFAPDGTILDANENFCAAMSYGLADIRGKHHRMFADADYAASADYARLWTRLRAGEFVAGEFRRLARGGRVIWLQASYNPIFDSSNRVVRVVKFAVDITSAKERAIDAQGQIEAINRSSGVIEFALDGTILSANENFLQVVGYSLAEVQGKHHRMFVDPAETGGLEYRMFWDRLRAGEYVGGHFRRRAKGGADIWIQATYSPIRDPDGRVVKVVKYASDTTSQVRRNKALRETIDTSLCGIVRNVGDVAGKATEIARSADTTATTIQGVAAAAEELNASIREISTSTVASQRSLDETLALPRSVDQAASELARNAQQMTGIIDLIDSIASQINLLALNATIESARAGDAGRGFAVVASEVKQLAQQVTSATRTISSEVESVQAIAAGAARGLGDIRDSMNRATLAVTSVATAVAQQSGATNEISRTIQAAAASVTSINRDVSGVAAAVNDAAELTKSVGANIRSLVA